MWLPQLISSHIQICFENKPFSRFVVSLERLGERPWVTERPRKTSLALKDLESQKSCEKTEKPAKRSSDRKKIQNIPTAWSGNILSLLQSSGLL